MAGQTLSAGTVGRKRVLFGLLDGDGWTWASVKAAFWFVVIVMMLGYLPDRAYYATVFPTIDLGVLVFSPINFCPGENRTVPCPAPAGATLPWDPSPVELALPGPRTQGTAVQVGTRMLYVGGSDGKTATDTTYLADFYSGTFGPWRAGPSLPAPRAAAATIFLNQSVYVAGGLDATGAPTDTVFVASQDLATGQLGAFTEDPLLKLPEARSGASILAASDGLILIGGRSAAGPQPTVWKATLDSSAKLGTWTPQAALPVGTADAAAAIVGSAVYLYGGSTASGPVGTVLRGNLGTASTTAGTVQSWDIGGDGTNLPVARSQASGFSANGVIYLIGGSDGTAPQGQLYWTIPDAKGDLPGWQNLPATDLPVGVDGSSAIVNGSQVFLIGGTTVDQPAVVGSARANLAPHQPFFQLGLFGATVPALAIGGEVGQQLGYLNAANVGIVDFILLILIGWAFAHKERSKEIGRKIVERLRR
jgi:hypothetical protein